MVVVGLIVEFAEDLRELITERPFKWRLLRTMVGGLLITIGVAGELFVHAAEGALDPGLGLEIQV